MQRSYHHNTTNLDSFHRPAHRIASAGSLQERAAPYGHGDFRFDSRPEYFSRQSSYSVNQEPENAGNGSQSRRRIAIACARCRRRKIRCSGDPGDKTGCTNCRASGTDISNCIFNRVGSEAVVFHSLQPLSTTASMSLQQQQASETDAGAREVLHYEPVARPRAIDHRTSLPTLHTRTSISRDGQQQYHEPLPYDFYGPRSASSQRSHASWGLLNAQDPYRWYAGVPMTLPARHDSVTTTVMDHNYAPLYHYTSASGLSESTHDTFSPTMNLSGLGASLPVQAPRERHLPIPYTTVPPPHTALHMRPEVRAMEASVGFRPMAIHDRTALPWTYDEKPSVYSSTTCAPGVTTQTDSHNTSAPLEPAFGYQFQSSTAYSPNVSPTSGPELSESFAGLSTVADTQDGVTGRVSTATYRDSLTTSSSHRRSSTRQDDAPGLYSFNTDAAERLNMATGLGQHDINCNSYSIDNGPRYTSVRHHQQSYPDAHKGQYNLEYQQRHRRASDHRVSVPALNGRL